MSIRNIYLRKKISNGGGGGKSAPAPAPAAAAPAPPPTDTGPDPAMQAEIERQRALRFKAGQTGTDGATTGDQQATGTTEDPNKKTTTILGA